VASSSAESSSGRRPQQAPLDPVDEAAADEAGLGHAAELVRATVERPGDHRPVRLLPYEPLSIGRELHEPRSPELLHAAGGRVEEAHVEGDPHVGVGPRRVSHHQAPSPIPLGELHGERIELLGDERRLRPLQHE
jgi:hypothetical protein